MGRGAHGPAPVSASLYRLRRQTALLGTASPSSRQRVGGGKDNAARSIRIDPSANTPVLDRLSALDRDDVNRFAFDNRAV